MHATIEDVARTAGVSAATVSRALRGLPNVAPSTRERVVRVAKELNYVITPHVARLISGRRVIGLLAPLVDQWFFNKLLTTIELELLNLGYDAVRYHIDTPENQTNLLQQLTSEKLVDGLILTSVTLAEEDREILTRNEIAAVTIESSNPGIDSVTIDNEAAAELATRHLINLGHTRIGLATGLQSTLPYEIPGLRTCGYRRALEMANIAYRPELVQDGSFSFDGGAEAMKLLYLVHEPPTALFAMSDEMAIGALKTLRDLNLAAPANFSVIGFDDHDVAHYVDLTTIRQPVSQYGILGAQALVERLESPLPLPPRKIVCQPELIVRGTTGPAPLTRWR